MKLRQSPRLKHFDYKGRYAYFLTSATRRRLACFSSEELLGMGEQCLLEASRHHDFRLLAYCFMPDHVHILALAEHQHCDMQAFARRFKQRSSYLTKKLSGRELWQISYHDRVIRCHEDLNDVARYVWHNPVRAGLVKDFRDYPGSGPRPLPPELL